MEHRDVGADILSLYDKAKYKIYDSYIQLQRQAAACAEPRKGKIKKRISRIEYTKRFNKFYFNLIAIPEYKKLLPELKDLMEYYAEYGTHLFENYKEIKRSTIICANAIEGLNITRITNLKRQRAF